MKEGTIITLSGVSGAGKSHFIKSLLSRFEDFDKLKAVTTRKIRTGEVDGVDKYFLNLDEFNKKYENNELCVVNNVFGNMYAYLNSDINKTKEGKNLVTELYYEEVDNFKKEHPNTISVYVLPSDISKTIDQLKDRNTTVEEFEKRLSDIKTELGFFSDNKHHTFDIVISNNYDQESVERFINAVLDKIDSSQMFISSEDLLLQNNLETETKNVVDNFVLNNKSKNVVYTSFDGDDMQFLHNICKYEIDRGNIPLNPETSLGYYVSTVSLGGKKKDVMMDCLTLEMMADKMSVYAKDNRPLAEGIMAEILLWHDLKSSGLDIINGVTQIKQNPNHKELSRTELENYVLSQDDILKYELYNNLLNEYKDSNHETAYIIANIENFKHIDWARSYCYSQKKCPISPQNILPLYQYENNLNAYIESRLELLRHSDEILLFIDKNNLKEDLNKLDQFSLAEIYFAKTYLNKKIKIIGWDEALVPKYNQNSKWSLTTKEDIEVRKMLK